MSKHSNSLLIIAHRGGGKNDSKTENTIETFQSAIKHQIKMVEFDVRKTKDHQLVVFHNDQIQHKKLKTLTYRQLNELAQKEGYEVPKFLDVLNLCKNKIKLDIELKEDGYVKETLDLLEKTIPYSQYVITSFLDSVVRQVKEQNPSIQAGLLIGLENASWIQRLREIIPFLRLWRIKADFVAPNYKLITPWLIFFCRLFHYPIYVWTVNNDRLFYKLRKKRVMAIITDYPIRYFGIERKERSDIIC